MCGFNLEALARAHTVVEHCPGLFGDFEGRFRSTEHPQVARKAAERNSYSRWAPQLPRQRAGLVRAASYLVLTHAHAPSAAPQDDAAGAEPRLLDFCIIEGATKGAHLSPMPQTLNGIAGAGPLGSAAMPAHRLHEIGGLFPVMRQQRRLLVEVLRMGRLDDAGDRRVEAFAPLLELRGQRHFLG